MVLFLVFYCPINSERVEGPTFLFRLALAVLKMNEAILGEPGNEDTVMPTLREFFRALGCGEELAPLEFDRMKLTEDCRPMTGNDLSRHLFELAFNYWIPIDQLESLRMRHRLGVVHSIEDSARKTQIRNLREGTNFTEREIGLLYDEFRKLMFFDLESGSFQKNSSNSISTEGNADAEAPPGGLISSRMFYKLMSELSPWHEQWAPRLPDTVPSPSSNPPIMWWMKPAAMVSMNGLSVRLRAFPVRVSLLLGSQPSESSIHLFDRMFEYGARMTRSQTGSSTKGVDLTTLVSMMDVLCKQTSNARIRFYFRIFDEDGDNYLNTDEFSNAVDGLLWILFGGGTAQWSSALEVIASAAENCPITEWGEGMGQFASRFNDRVDIHGGKREEIVVSQLASFVKEASRLQGSKSSSFNSVSAVDNQKIASQESGSRILISPVYDSLQEAVKGIPKDLQLDFNNFLLLILSESTLVEFFETRGEL